MENRSSEKLPKVSCTCITYGRPRLLEEAMQSFIMQTYEGEMELVILNDDVNSHLEYKGKHKNREIRVINSEKRFRTIGEKRNECSRLSTGSIILPWDDDDIHMHHRAKITVERMAGKDYWKGDSLWFTTNGKISKNTPTITMAPSMAGYSRKVFDKVGGYDHIDSGQDQTLEKKFKNLGIRVQEVLLPEEIYYIYRFGGTGSYHLSSFGYGKGVAEAGKFVEKKVKKGPQILTPMYRSDYQIEVDRVIRLMKANPK